MKKTLQIIGNSNYGGASYLILSWCKYLIDKDWQVDVLATDPLFVSKLRNIPGIRVWDNLYIPREISILNDIIALFELRKYIKRERYDVVHTYTATPGFLGRISAWLAKTPIILHHQAAWTFTKVSPRIKRFAYLPMEYSAGMVSTKIICVSHAIADQALDMHIVPSRKLIIVQNGINPDPFILAGEDDSRSLWRNNFRVKPETILIGNCGRLSLEKDNATLIRAFRLLNDSIPGCDLRLVIIGEGAERENLENLISQSGLQDRIRLLGFRDDIPAILSSLDYFVSPSYREGLSISLLEAMASALPIVTTNIPANMELITDEVTGLVVPPGSPESICQALIRFLDEPTLRSNCTKNAREHVLKNFTIERWLQETYQMYIN